MACDGARDAVEVGGPAAVGGELVGCGVQRCGAAGAGIGAGLRGVLVVGAGEGGLRARLAEDTELFWFLLGATIGDCGVWLEGGGQDSSSG